MGEDRSAAPEADPRAKWRKLPDSVEPIREGQALESDASLWDRPPKYDPNMG
ncbi:hypothetical protein [Rhodococcus sp. IEGM 1330]|uniref:hypothetical protein n=1 Tax=Rhodococcus sp. IEGM 1330 TaxID=3082225 RepID=UPI0029529C60|nr:hypothetical protein [Rhodococcus sp. IEGM 1330]MDV8025277.1 hypothetical protein [Rhodococcus sp. IEGM 1330]